LGGVYVWVKTGSIFGWVEHLKSSGDDTSRDWSELESSITMF
jgi:hypothetical protein